MGKIGIYLGRHKGTGGGIGLYCQSLLKYSQEFLQKNPQHQVIFYGDDFFKDNLVARLEQGGSVISFKGLPKIGGRRFGFLIDQFFIPLQAIFDRVELLHATTNTGFIFSRRPQIITVHDLFQAYPIVGTKEHDSWYQRVQKFCYQTLFKLQFGLRPTVITVGQGVTKEIKARFAYPEGKINCIPLGLDNIFSEFITEINSSEQLLSKCKIFLEKYGLSSGYTLVLASSDPRKNLKNTLRAWLLIGEEDPKSNLVINFLDRFSKQISFEVLSEKVTQEAFNGSVQSLQGMSREELPLLFFCARVLFVPTLAEGFGLPALEAVCLGTPVVTSRLEHLTETNDRVFFCDPANVEDIARALRKAEAFLDQQKDLKSLWLAKKDYCLATIDLQRKMEDVVKETFSLYTTVLNDLA